MLAISFLRPEFLWLLALLPIVWVWPRRVRDSRHAILRSMVLGLTILALAAPVRITSDDREHQVLLVDLSASTAPEARGLVVRDLQGLVERLPADARISLIGLGTAALPAGLEHRLHQVQQLSAGRSDLGAALALANLQIPVGARGAVTCLTDGLATDRGWAVAMQSLSARGIPLHGIVLPSVEQDVRPLAITTADGLRVGQTGRVLVDVHGPRSRIRLHLEGPGGRLSSSEVLDIDGWRQVGLSFEPGKAGFFEFHAVVEVIAGTDLRPDNNRINTLLAVQDPLRILYLGGRVRGSADKLGQLLGKGFAIEPIGDPSPQHPGLDSYDLVMFDDAPAHSVPREFQKRVVRHVVDQGLGVCMAGGAGSFGPGGYRQTPIDSLLPVDMVQKEEKKDPSTALAIIIDTSGSMGGNRIVLAKEVTRLALRRLLPHDKVGIVEFYGNKHWAAPLQSAANAIDIQRALNRLDAGGGTILFPAIEEAYFGLRNVRTRYKHVLVLTDAGVESGPYEQLLRRMARDGICVSTVLVGPGRHSEFLVELADWGRGRFYNASDRFNLPEIMLKQPSSSRLPSYRPGRQEVEARGGQGWWGATGRRRVPPIDGYVETRPRPGADVLLRTKRDGHPVLASWRFGLGRVTVLTTEPTGAGTAGWQDWPGYGAMLGRVLARTAADSGSPFRFKLLRRDHQLVLTAHRLAPGELRPRAELQAETPRRFAFRERAVGQFEARLTLAPEQAARVLAGVEGRSRGTVRLASRAFADCSDELQADPQRRFDLAAAASTTGGEFLTANRLADFVPPAGGADRALAIHRLWPVCLLLALLTYLVELLWRRRPGHRVTQ